MEKARSLSPVAPGFDPLYVASFTWNKAQPAPIADHKDDVSRGCILADYHFVC